VSALRDLGLLSNQFAVSSSHRAFTGQLWIWVHALNASERELDLLETLRQSRRATIACKSSSRFWWDLLLEFNPCVGLTHV
jgi:hypothetical protein